MCKVYTGYCGTSEIEHGLCACTVDNPLAKARGLSLRTGAQPMLYLPHNDNNKTQQMRLHSSGASPQLGLLDFQSTVILENVGHAKQK